MKLPAYQGAVIVRTRDQPTLDKCDAVVDVGGRYEQNQHRYDHHQREFNDSMTELNCKTKLSSAGLIYRHFGLDIIKHIVGTTNQDALDALFRKIYKSFLEEIDGNDNGVEIFQAGTRNYEANTSLPARVQELNPAWNADKSDSSINACFARALEVVGSEFATKVRLFVDAWWPARAVVAAALKSAAAVHGSRQILILDRYVPYDSHLYELEEEMLAGGDMACMDAAKFVLYEEPNGDWRIKTVAESLGSFTPRLKFPEAWGGLEGEELSSAAGLEGCIFVHAGRFIGGNKSKAGALQMVLKSIGSDQPCCAGPRQANADRAFKSASTDKDAEVDRTADKHVVVSTLAQTEATGGATTPLIGTHSGTFHCDEVLACAMLKMLPAYQGAVIVRTRDQP